MKKSKIIGILRNIDEKNILKIGEILIKYKILDFEVTYNTKNSLNIFKILKKEFKNAKIGMGTILNIEQLKEAEGLGADFILTPSITKEVLEYSAKNKINLIPGVFSPSEVAFALEYNFSYLKLFPAINLPDSYIKNLIGPFDKAEFMAVGGVEKENLEHFFKLGFKSVGMGSSLIKKNYVENQDWSKLEKHISEISKIIEKLSI